MKLIQSIIAPFLLFSITVYASIHVTISNETFEDRISSFGPRLSPNGMIGFMIEPSQDPTGCSLVEAPSSSSDWIALVQRGGCSFITKVRYMQKSGAIAVVVGDPKSSGWITMYSPGDTSDIQIPSIFLAKNEYKKLLHLSKLLNTPMVAILQPDTNVTWPLMDILLIIIASPSIMLLFIYASWRLRQRILRKRELAPVSVVSKLSVKIFNVQETKEEEEPESCAICLEDYESGDELRLLPCNHLFHTMCVDSWLCAHQKFCPICKYDICSGKKVKTVKTSDEYTLLSTNV